jgi:hypothetical protein
MGLPSDRVNALMMAWCMAFALLATGCVGAGNYRFGSREQFIVSPGLSSSDEALIERGKRRPLVDGLGWVVGIPGRLLLWDRRVDNHRIGAETEGAIATYLAANQMTDVKVRINQYAPLQDWKRLREHTAVAWPYRYTFGVFAWLGETVFAGRIFGGDHYNPYTHTIHLYSDVPAIALHEGGHAKDFSQRTYKGTYAAVYMLPGVSLYHEAIATSDALHYLRDTAPIQSQQEAVQILYPAYATYVGGAIGWAVPLHPIANYGIVVVGHGIGQLQADRLAPASP